MKKFYGRIKHGIFCLLLVLIGQSLVAQNICPPNIDFETGTWNNWQIFAGQVGNSGTTRTYTLNPTAPIALRHTLLPQNTAIDPYGGFPMSPPNSSGYSIRLGFPNEPNPSANCERVSYQFTIPTGSTSYSLTYQYAVVFENPVSHQPYQQPQFEAKIYNVTTGQYINCASFSFYATANIPGFSLSPTVSNHGEQVWFKPWTPVTVNLTGYAGHTLVLEFTNADCTLSGHWAYSYIDVNAGCNSPIAGAEFCPGSTSVNVVAPYGYQSYTWWNSTFTQQITNQQTMTLTPPPTANTVYAVDVVPYPGFGCRDTVYATVKPLPVVPANAGTDRVYCGSGSSQTPAPLGSPAQSGYTYSWSPAAGLNDPTIAQPIATPSTTTSYVLTVTDVATSCTKKDTVLVTIAPPIYPTFTVNNANQCLAGNNFQFTSSTSNPTGLTYAWDFGVAGGTSSQQNPSFQYTTAGTYTVKLILTSSTGCVDSSSQTVTVSAAPLANAGPDKLLCGGSATSTVIGGSAAVPGYTYSWSPATGLSNANIAQPTASPTASTQYILTVSGNGNCVSKDTVNVNVAPSISATFTVGASATQCFLGHQFNFTSNASNPSGLTYSWTFGDNTGVSSLANPSYQYSAPGTYTVKLVVSAAGGGCKDSTTTTVTVNPSPTAGAGADQQICGGSTQTVTLGSPSVPGYTYSWSPATGLSSATAAQPTVTIGTPTSTSTTNYILTVTAPGGCIAKDTVAVTITATLNGVFTVNNATQCLTGNNFQFNSNNPAGTTYAWDFGVPGGTSNQQNPSYQYANPGTYTVKLVVSNATGCKDSSTLTMNVSAMPVASAGADQTMCGGTTQTITIGSPAVTGYTYSWSPATGLSSASAAQPTVTAGSPTSTQVISYILTVSAAGGCVAKDTVVVTVTPTLTGAFTINNANQCLNGNNFQFNTSNPAGSTYSWNFGVAGGSSTQQNPTYQYAAAGTYTVKLVVSNAAGCKDSSTQTVTVSAMPVANAGADQMLCGGTSASVTIGTPAIPGYTYSWSPSTGLNNSNTAQPVASPSVTTDYIVTVSAPGGCSAKDTVRVVVTQTLSPAFNVNNITQCITGNNFQFTMANPIGGLTYAWDFGVPGATSTQQNPSYTYAAPGTYTVKVVLSTANGCKDSSTKVVTVSALPTATISASATNICEGTPVVLTATGSPANTYRWYKDGLLVATTTTNTYNATQAGTYTFDLNNGCTNPGTGSVTLTLTKKPTVDFSYTTMCLGYPTPFTDLSNVSGSQPVSYSWNFGSASVPGSTQPSPTVTYGAAGTYNVQFTVTPQSCPQLATTAQKNVVIKGPVPGTKYTDKAALENVPLQLQARNIGTTFLWDPATSLNNDAIMAPVFQGMTDQLYTITITDAQGCVTVDTQQVKVYKEVNIYVPKAFTPNNDGLNDYMYPFLVGIKELKMFRIINRWGVVVYQARVDLPGWDGKFKGAAQPMDGYVWEIQAIDYFGRTHTRYGSFTLIR